MPKQLDKVLYTAQAHTTGGRDGASKSSDGVIDIKLSSPGSGKPGTNPEQLFAAGYAACFLSALKFVAAQSKKTVPEGTKVTSTVGIGPRDEGGFGLDVALAVALPGMPRAEGQALIDQAHQVCPYSNATRNNIPVRLSLV